MRVLDSGFWNVVTKKREERCKRADTHPLDMRGNNRSLLTDSNKKESFVDEDSQMISDHSIDVVIVTAVDDEFNAVREIYESNNCKHNIYSEKGFYYYLTSQVVDSKTISIAIVRQKAMGLIHGAITATAAIMTFNPKLIAMCGICAGISNDAKLGDILIPSATYNYESGKYDETGFHPESCQRSLSSRIEQLVHHNPNTHTQLVATIRNVNKIHIPDSLNCDVVQILHGPMASGGAVVADPEIVESIIQRQRNVSGIDMEAAALAEAAHNVGSSETPWIVIKAVQDKANFSKSDEFRDFGVRVSANMLYKFIELYFASCDSLSDEA